MDHKNVQTSDRNTKFLKSRTELDQVQENLKKNGPTRTEVSADQAVHGSRITCIGQLTSKLVFGNFLENVDMISECCLDKIFNQNNLKLILSVLLIVSIS